MRNELIGSLVQVQKGELKQKELQLRSSFLMSYSSSTSPF
jgi:hypothetical protein